MGSDKAHVPESIKRDEIFTISCNDKIQKKFISQGAIRVKLVSKTGKHDPVVYFTPSTKYSFTLPSDEKKLFGLFIPSTLSKLGKDSKEGKSAYLFGTKNGEVKIRCKKFSKRISELALASVNRTLVEVKVRVQKKKAHLLILDSISMPAPKKK